MAVSRSIDGVFVNGDARQRPASRNANTAKVKALPHLAPYTPNVARQNITHLRPHGELRPPVVVDDMLKPGSPRSRRQASLTVAAAPKQLAVSPKPAKSIRQAKAPTHPQPQKKPSLGKRLLNLAQYPALAIIALLAAHSINIGQWFVLAYALYVLIRKVPSQASFGMALFLLVSIPVFQLLHQAGIAQNIAVYVYELLVVGTVQAIIELYKSRHKTRAHS